MHTKLNKDIAKFEQVFPITDDMVTQFEGVSRLIMLDRYAFKDSAKETLTTGDLVILTVSPDPKFPARGIGKVVSICDGKVIVQLEEAYAAHGDEFGNITADISAIDKPLELFYEQIAHRVAKGIAAVETTQEARDEAYAAFFHELSELNFVPAGRVIYGAGTGTDVTFFNCFVMPMPKDSREGIGHHRNEVMEIMSRGGGVGTNGSTLRPRNARARGVNGRSSGSVSWLNDIAQLTHLVEQGGSRRGAQMIMLADWHPDILEFVIAKMQNPKILRLIIETTGDDEIRALAKEKLKFTPFTTEYRELMNTAYNWHEERSNYEEMNRIDAIMEDGGTYTVQNPDFLTGANISVAITTEFMQAVESDSDYDLRFPDVENYSEYDMALYNDTWHMYGDVRKWDRFGFGIKTYRTIKAKELWNLINICATYSAEPGIFFLDNANEATNAQGYGMQVVATNPCGEQPLAPYSVCNLAAINLAQMVDKTTKKVDFEKLAKTARTGVHFGDNVISATPYFLEANKTQALGERRVGMGVMGLADLLIYCEEEYGSPSGNALFDQILETTTIAAHSKTIDLAKTKGTFPLLEGNHEKFIESGFMKSMPQSIREGVLVHGIRNSHLLTVAPTGTTGSMIGVATGLEPYFSFKYYRSGRLGSYMEVVAAIVQEYLDENPGASSDALPSWFISTMALSPEAHVDVQCIIQRWIDSSLSKTVNAPKGYTVEQVQGVYERLYAGGAKGGTVYVDGSRDAQVLTLSNGDDEAETTPEPAQEERKVIAVDTINELRATSVSNVGNEVGDTCPVCKIGTVIDAGGCSTCSNCSAQLKCGL